MESANHSSVLVFFVNGKKVIEIKPNPEWTLLYYLRNKLKLCGTKQGCAEGGCGTCTVMVSKYIRQTNKIKHLAVNACLAPVCSMHGLAVTTVEGIGSTGSKLHPVQERIASSHGSQCGFCTPGIVMSMYALLRTMPKPSVKDLETAFQGNLCRCTGYRPIVEGFRTFTEEWENVQQTSSSTNGSCPMGDKCCKLATKSEDDRSTLYERSKFAPYDPTQEPIFPPELKLNDQWDKECLTFQHDNLTWYRPLKLESLLELKSKHPEAKIVAGNTEIGIEMKFKAMNYTVFVQPGAIEEMNTVTVTESYVSVGSAVTLQTLDTELKKLIETLPQSRTKVLTSIVDILHWFAGQQTRNVASVGGNVMTSSPISDLNPIFLAANAQLTVQSLAGGKRTVTMDEKFFTGYRKNVINQDEVLIDIRIPFSTPEQHFYAFKQARRKEDDVAIVNAAFNVTFRKGTKIVADIKLAFGGMSEVTILANRTRSSLIGKEWNESLVETAYANLIEDLPLPANAPGGMIQYRKSLALSMFFKAFLKISEELHAEMPQTYRSGSGDLRKETPKSSQYFQVNPDILNKHDGVRRPIMHKSALQHATGEAVFCDDLPKTDNELIMCFVLSSNAHANVRLVDASAALKVPGVVAFFSAKDLEGRYENQAGAVVKDQEVFVSKTVTAEGQIIGAIVAEDELIARKAARAVRIEYEELKPVIVSIEDAIKYGSYFTDRPIELASGNVDKAFAESDHVLEGECRTGGQEHFYLEPNCCIATPKKEDDEMEIFVTSQHPTGISTMVSEFLGVPQNKIVTKVKRIGGGFGGKETRPFMIALPAAFAAKQLGRPVRCTLDRDEDIILTGGRHPFLMKYKVGFSKDGKLNACQVLFYANAGYSLDISAIAMERALTNFENAFYIPNVKAIGYVCKTNLRSNTAFRGTGAPQSMLVAENIIRNVAEFLNRDATEIAYLNLYKETDTTYYGMKITRCTLQRCWNECLVMADFENRKSLLEEYNAKNRWKKRGICVIPTKFGIGFNPLHLNQAAALVLVYTDGSVLLSHGGAEMGQGLHTKMIQIASQVLDIPTSKIHISETATDKIPNASPTAGSVSSDLNGMAVLEACTTIKNRLEPYKAKNPNGQWNDWVKEAYFDRVSLSATGFYKTPDMGYDPATNSGNLHNYFTYGVACTEAEIDCLTGDHRVIRTDIVMDVGESLNPAVDIGQIEGAFMHGYGLYMLEEMVYSPAGNTYTKGPGTYKLPGFGDIPEQFNVALLKGAPNPRAVYSSKAIGEPPLFLASSVLFAVREAIKSARKDAGISTSFRLDAPATSAAIRMACVDNITTKFKDTDPNTYIPWNVKP